MAISVECFLLDRSTDATLQIRIRQMVAESILSGRLRPGERMPSSRAMSAHLGVSRITVSLAYADLVADDFLRVEGRSGFFVSETAPKPSPLKGVVAGTGATIDLDHHLAPSRGFGGLRMSKPANWRDYRFPFVYGQADQTLFDHANWRASMIRALGQKNFDRMTDDQFQADDPVLLEYIARHTLPRRGILARPEEILVTLGAQNALWLAAQVLLDASRVAVIEDPGYPGLRAILQQTRCTMASVPIGPRGLNIGALPPAFDVVFCTPSHHCPTGATMPIEARQDLLNAANAADALIIEDDYEFEISQHGAPLPALKSLDRAGRVIHIGSFSKSLFPGLRLGFMVAPEPIIRAARDLRATVLRHPPGLMQRAAANFLSLGHYDSMLRRLGQAFAERRRVMLGAIRDHGLEIAGAIDDGGSSLWMRAPEEVDARRLATQLRDDSVLIEPGAPFFDTPQGQERYFRLAYSSIPADKIKEGIARIAARISRMAQ